MTTTKTNQHTGTAVPDSPSAAAAAPKKTFVEPAISQPVDVLEATTFFQVADSGATGFKKKH